MAKTKAKVPDAATLPAEDEAKIPPVEAAAEAPPIADEIPPTPVEAEPVPPVAAETPPPVEETPVGVATPDGRGVHPFEVLQSERDKAAAAEAKAADLEEALRAAQTSLAEAQQANAELQAALQTTAPAPETGMQEGGEVELPELGEGGEISGDEHEMLSTLEMPGISSAIKQIPAIIAHVKALTSLVRQLVDIDNERYQQEVDEEAKEHAAASEENWREMTTALDNLPLARYYEAKNPAAWEDFITFHDDLINKHPQHSQLPHAERFRKALDMAKAIHGDELGLDSGGLIPKREGMEKGGLIPKRSEGGPEDVGTVASAGELEDATPPEAHLDIDLNEPPTNTSDEDNVKKLTNEELTKKLGVAPKAVSVKKTAVTLSAIPGGMSAEDTSDVPLIKKKGIGEFKKAIQAAKSPEEASKIQAEWARAG